MRSGLSDFWPRKLRMRRSKGLFDLPWQEALRPLALSILRTGKLHLDEHGYLDHGSVLARLQRLSAGLDCNEGQLQHIILLEFWLRNRAENGIGGKFGNLLKQPIAMKGGESNAEKLRSS
jgi:hypothetical protein